LEAETGELTKRVGQARTTQERTEVEQRIRENEGLLREMRGEEAAAPTAAPQVPFREPAEEAVPKPDRFRDLAPEKRQQLSRAVEEDIVDLEKQLRISGLGEPMGLGEERVRLREDIAEKRALLEELRGNVRELGDEWVSSVRGLKGSRASLAREIVSDKKRATHPLTPTEQDLIQSIGDGFNLGKGKLAKTDPMRRWPLNEAKALNSLIKRGVLKVVEKTDGRRVIEIDAAAADRALGEAIAKEANVGTGSRKAPDFGGAGFLSTAEEVAGLAPLEHPRESGFGREESRGRRGGSGGGPASEIVAEYGGRNQVFTRDAYDAALRSVNEKTGRLNLGADPTVAKDLVTIGGYHFEAGLRTFAQWSQAMVRTVGERVRPLLEQLWSQVRERFGRETPTFYSRAAKTLAQKMPASATAEQVRGILRGQGSGVTAEELKWIGLEDFLAGKEKVSKQEVLEFIRQNDVKIEEVSKGALRRFPLFLESKTKEGKRQWVTNEGDYEYVITQESRNQFRAERHVTKSGHMLDEVFDSYDKAVSWFKGMRGEDLTGGTKFSQYTLPGPKENYRELLLTLPDKTERVGIDRKAPGSALQMTEAERRAGTFTGGHFEEPNVLAHVRFDDRIDAQGKKVLFVEEIQSDWHQKGKRYGYQRPLTVEEQQRVGALREEYRSLQEQRELAFGGIEQRGLPRLTELEEQRLPSLRRLEERGQLSRNERIELEELERRQGAVRTLPPERYELPEGYRAIEATNNPSERRWIVTEEGSTTVLNAGPTREAAIRNTIDGFREAGRLTGYESLVAQRVNGRQSEINQELNTLYNKPTQGVPEAPFAKTWHELVLKRMLRYAAENGYDKVGWTTGEQQAARYDLNKQVDAIQWNPRFGSVRVLLKDGAWKFIKDRGVTESNLADYVGKEPAQKLIQGPSAAGERYAFGKAEEIGGWREIRGEDLKVGGEALKSLYDRILPEFLNKYGKRWGAEVRTAQLEMPFTGELRGRAGETAIQALERQRGGEMADVHSLTVSPEMRRSVLEEGQPLFGSERGFAAPEFVFGERGAKALTKAGEKLRGEEQPAPPAERPLTPEELRRQRIAEKGKLRVLPAEPRPQVPFAVAEAPRAAAPRPASEVLPQVPFRSPAPSGAGGVGQPPRPPARGQLDVATPRLKQVEAAREARPSSASRILETAKEIPTNAVRKFVSQFVDIEQMVRGAQKRGIKVKPEQNPAIINDLVYGGTGGRLELAAMDYRAVVEQATKSGLRRALNNYLDLRGYDRAIRIIEERIAEAEKAGDKNAAAELRGRIERNEVVPAEYTRETIAADLKAIEAKLGPKNFAEVKRLAEQVNNLNRAAWDMAHKEGLISQAVYDQGLRRGNDYIPLERIMDDVVADSQSRIRQTLSLKQQQILKRLEGSKRVNVDPVQASLERHAETIREAGRNEAARTLIEFRKIDPEGFGKQVFEVKEGQKLPQGMGTIAFYEAGTKKLFAMPDLYANAMNLANAHELTFSRNALLRLTRSGFRVGATTGNLAFSLPNVIRDISEMSVLSKAGVSKPLDPLLIIGQFAKSVYEVASKSERYREFLRSRAAFSTLQKNIDPAPFLARGEPLQGVKRLNPLRVIDGIESFNNWLEEATKLTTFKRARRMGMAEVEAAFETRRYGGSPDFARRGTVSADINLAVMFFNAQVQGITRMARILGQPRRLAGFLSVMTAAELALYSWNQQFRDEDGNLELDRVPRWERDTHWVILRPDTYQTSSGRIRHRVIKIRKGDTMEVVSNPLERAIEGASGGKVDIPQVALDTISGLTPGQPQLKRGEIGRSLGRGVISTLNPILRAPLEQLANREMFRDVPIVPRSLEEAIPGEQKRETTSPVAVAVGRKIGVSPLRLEHGIRSFFAGLGEQGLNIADAVYGDDRRRLPLEGDEEIARTRVLGPILRRFVGSTMDQKEKDLEEDFYDRYDQARETVRTFNLMAESDEARAEEFLSDPERLVLYHLNGEIQTAVRDLSDIRDLQRETARSDMSDAEKKEAIRFLHQQRLEILRGTTELVEELLAEERSRNPRQSENRFVPFRAPESLPEARP